MSLYILCLIYFSILLFALSYIIVLCFSLGISKISWWFKHSVPPRLLIQFLFFDFAALDFLIHILVLRGFTWCDFNLKNFKGFIVYKSTIQC